jgi:hypothetical protein
VTTHLLEFSDVVVKRFRSYDRGEHRREWLGLRLLDRHSPGLAPRPLSADLAADPPAVTMSRLPGEPLGGRPLIPAELVALADAMDRLHSAVPVDEAARLDPSHGHPHRGLASLQALLDAHPGSPDEPTVAAAVAAARQWLASAEAVGAADLDGVPAVLGREDHNLPNFLRDGDRIALVDFEDSGRSDRATEWAALVEHRAARCTADADWRPFLDAVADQPRLRAARRYYACVWVALMLPGRPGHDRNPPPARRAQAERLLELLRAG